MLVARMRTSSGCPDWRAALVRWSSSVAGSTALLDGRDTSLARRKARGA